ncbi:hypothetical protein M0R04_15075 [Candidatus Dojkabacteria bacterium]|jgi:hypothetical protein|nr:hypothetical protein [Candidatus Dojkabacteria bacterium]
MIIKKCKQCKNIFKVKFSRKNKAKFCSRKCFGEWQILGLKGEANPHWQGGKLLLNCLFCNKKFMNNPSRIKTGRGKYCSKKCKLNASVKIITKICLICEKDFKTIPSKIKKGNGKFCSKPCYGQWMRKNRQGKNAGGWKGGISPFNVLIRHSTDYKEWAKLIKERDSFICQICKIRGGKLRSNHIKKFSDYPELRTVLTNGITICKDCDIKFVLHREKEWEEYFNLNLKNRGYLTNQE